MFWPEVSIPREEIVRKFVRRALNAIAPVGASCRRTGTNWRNSIFLLVKDIVERNAVNHIIVSAPSFYERKRLSKNSTYEEKSIFENKNSAVCDAMNIHLFAIATVWLDCTERSLFFWSFRETHITNLVVLLSRCSSSPPWAFVADEKCWRRHLVSSPPDDCYACVWFAASCPRTEWETQELTTKSVSSKARTVRIGTHIFMTDWMTEWLAVAPWDSLNLLSAKFSAEPLRR